LELAKRGDELVGCCPFHEDSKASFYANTKKNVFQCFGCQASGNILDLVVLFEACSIKKAAELVADWQGIESTYEDGLKGKSKGKRASGQARRAKKPEVAVEGEKGNAPLKFALQNLDPNHPYLVNRNLSPQTIAHFGLGYCSRGMHKGRIAIPIHSEKGELVAYAGRWAGDQGLPEGEGKYKLPPGFSKGQVLFNLNRVEPGAKTVIVVEGYFPVFWLHQCGFPSVVALMGRTLPAKQKELLAKHFKGVKLFLDGDQPGQEAAIAIAGDLARELWVKIIPCPSTLQPDDLSETDLRSLLK